MVSAFFPRSGGMKQNNKEWDKSMKKLIAIALITLITLITGCATVDGMGQDVSGAARGVKSWF